MFIYDTKKVLEEFETKIRYLGNASDRKILLSIDEMTKTHLLVKPCRMTSHLFCKFYLDRKLLQFFVLEGIS